MSPSPEHGRTYAVVLDGHGADSSLIGGKAAALDRLIGWGQVVPPTAVATADAFRAVVAGPRLAQLMSRIAQGEPIPADEVDAAFRAARIPADVLDAIVAAAHRIGGGGPLAIRSSATVEDMAQSSFAGQYRSLLNVPSDDRAALEHAVLDVFASLVHPAPRAYRDALGIDSSDIAMAAVMMAMVDARRAGVLFTLDPTLVEPTLRIEVVDGLGESLVSGKRTPTVHRFPRVDGPRGFEAAGVTDPALVKVLDAGLAIERSAGHPQDIEWAWDGSTLWLVQARPVTALRSAVDERFGVDPFDDDPAGLTDVELTTEGIGEMLPNVLPPLIWQLASLLAEEGFRIMLDRLGGDLSGAGEPRWLIRRVRGRAALDVGRLSTAMAPIPGAAQRIRAAYFGEQPSTDGPPPTARERVTRRLRTGRHLRQAEAARRLASFDAEVVLRAVGSLAHLDEVGSASSGHLLARHGELIALGIRATAAELTVSADAGAIHAAIRAMLGRFLSLDDAARWADRLTVPPPLPPALLNGSAAVFAGPSWTELGLVPVSRTPEHDVDADLSALEQLLESAPRWPAAGLRRRLTRRRLEHLVHRARRQFGRRETTKAALLVLGGEVRRIHLEVGRRLVAARRLDEPSDVDLLTLDELRHLVEATTDLPSAGPTRQEIERRRRVVQRHRAGSALPSRWQGAPARRTGDGERRRRRPLRLGRQWWSVHRSGPAGHRTGRLDRP